MRLHERINLVFGTTMVLIYLLGGAFVILYAEKILENYRTAQILGWVMVAYGLLRALRVYEILKKQKQEKTSARRHRDRYFC